ncbi:MAG: alpha-L-fucosidase [Tunicatimonas sp.]
MNRRDFVKASGLLAASGGLGAPPAFQPSAQVTNEVNPTATQQAWMDLGFGLFIHFGINTYYDMEWSDGTLDPARFNPTQLDTDQWCAAAKAAGMRYVVLITKHHDGFCLWPSEHTKYSVAATPFKKDIVAEVVNSATKHGLKVGFYYSLWDRNNALHDTNEPAYVDFMKQQLAELLTQYGPVVELWFDGFWKKQQHGWTEKNQNLGGEAVSEELSDARAQAFIHAWRMEGAYRWQMDHLYQFIKSLQPNCLVMNNATTAYPGVPLHPVDIRSGEKYTQVAEDQKVWEWLGKPLYLPLQIETTLSVRGNERFKSGNWFWHADDHSVASPETLRNYLATARAMEANLLLNAGPSDQGKLRPEDEQALKELRK